MPDTAQFNKNINQPDMPLAERLEGWPAFSGTVVEISQDQHRIKVQSENGDISYIRNIYTPPPYDLYTNKNIDTATQQTLLERLRNTRGLQLVETKNLGEYTTTLIHPLTGDLYKRSGLFVQTEHLGDNWNHLYSQTGDIVASTPYVQALQSVINVAKLHMQDYIEGKIETFFYDAVQLHQFMYDTNSDEIMCIDPDVLFFNQGSPITQEFVEIMEDAYIHTPMELLHQSIKKGGTYEPGYLNSSESVFTNNITIHTYTT